MENDQRHEMAGSYREPGTDEGHGRMQRAREVAREKLGRAKEGLAAGATSATEVGRHVVVGARERASRAAEFVRDAETNVELGQTVTHRTESSIGRAGEALTRAAPTIGRGTERAAEKLGEALQAISHPTGVVLGSIAGRLGGWWRKAAEERRGTSRREDEATQDHFGQVAAPSSGMSYEETRPAPSVGYVAGRNPDFDGRPSEEVEPELHEEFRAQESGGHDSSSESTRYVFERGDITES
ncbi:MAG TPA: hypothetical protein VF167_14725 [Longimicrobiaceae bacterium]